jgi:hypothetical protein
LALGSRTATLWTLETLYQRYHQSYWRQVKEAEKGMGDTWRWVLRLGRSLIRLKFWFMEGSLGRWPSADPSHFHF